LCLARPDLFFTVSSKSVRQNLSKVLGIAAGRFTNPSGYSELAKLIHNSPWFNTEKPKKKKEIEIWRRRAAFIDVILHE
jgi:hypothetical protein